MDGGFDTHVEICTSTSSLRTFLLTLFWPCPLDYQQARCQDLPVLGRWAVIRLRDQLDVGPLRPRKADSDWSRRGAETLALPDRIEVVDAQNGAVVSQIPAKGVLDIFLSPLGTQVQAWERQGAWYRHHTDCPAHLELIWPSLVLAVKPAEGEPPHMNLRIYDVRSGQEIAGFSQKSIENWSVL